MPAARQVSSSASMVLALRNSAALPIGHHGRARPPQERVAIAGAAGASAGAPAFATDLATGTATSSSRSRSGGGRRRVLPSPPSCWTERQQFGSPAMASSTQSFLVKAAVVSTIGLSCCQRLARCRAASSAASRRRCVATATPPPPPAAVAPEVAAEEGGEEVSAAEAQALLPGLRLWEDFISTEEEEELVKWLDSCNPPWKHEQFGVPTLYWSKEFGWRSTVQPRAARRPAAEAGEEEMPQSGILATLAARFQEREAPWCKELRGFDPNNANVNDYHRKEGHRLHMHWDDRGIFEDRLLSLSLLGDATMSFADSGRSNLRGGPESGLDKDGRRSACLRVRLPRRSLLLLRGAARYEWQHGIPEPTDFAADRRIAVIFRRVTKSTMRAFDKKVREDAAQADASVGERAASTLAAAREVATSAHSSTPPLEAVQRPQQIDAAIIFSTNWPDPEMSAAGRVTCGRIEALKEQLGVKTVAFASAAKAGTAMGRLAAASGVKCFRVAANDETSILKALDETKPQLIIFDGFNAEERYGHYVRAALPDAMRVLDMQDFHALRLGREALVAAGAGAAEVTAYRPDGSSEELLRELGAIHRCDGTLAISQDEASLLVEDYQIPPAKVLAAPLAYEPLSAYAQATLPSFAERSDVMFIGNWRHKPNQDCAQYLTQKVWPRVHELLPDVELNVYGSHPKPEDMALTNADVGAFVRGYCKSVEKTMSKHRLLVAPLRYGAGVKGKLTDSMRYGLVTVTTAVATEGLGGVEGYPGIVVSSCADDDEDAHASAFAEAIVQAYQDQERWEALQNRGLEFVDEHLSSKSVGAKLAAFLQEKWQSLPEARNKDYFGQMLWQNSLRSTQWMAKYIETKEELRQLKARRSQSEDNASAGAS
eukprot:TRINITY_DN26863_c0_g1_i1.p1 TRINITY_DN26863_c0_g1~~TRINITY_DN26863_c0_g1_i1.p1  ORF type:complete len:884 (-),score=243.48 TRINITY_DN26863_c0_g1_i1:316-2967(-)